jgi:hypothetical protein
MQAMTGAVWALISFASLATVAGCSASGSPGGNNRIGDNGKGGGGGTGGTVPTMGGTAGTIPTNGGTSSSPCTATTGTNLSGFVYDPAGKVPLYNIVVYVPVAGTEPPPMTEGASCEKCSGREAHAVAVAVTDSSGHFELTDVPAGDVPLVMEAGKWRRQVTIPDVRQCENNVIDDHDLTRLPRNQSEGHLPKIGMVTGHSDALECLLRKIGIADEEFTTDAGDGRVNMFYGCPNKDGVLGANHFVDGTEFPRAFTELYPNPDKLDDYDIIVLSCEGHSCDDEKTEGNQINLKAYSDAGGRILFDHMHYRWFNSDDAWQTVAEFSGSDDFPTPFTFQVDSSFPKGNDFADWLVSVGASTTRGELSVVAGQNSAQRAIQPYSQQWVYSTSPENVQYMTINTPVEAAEEEDAQCGRLVHTDLHLTSEATQDFSDQGTPFPEACTTADLVPQEKALEFILFDLGSCVQKDDRPIEPPVVR